MRYLSLSRPRVPDSVLEPIFTVCSGVQTLVLDGVHLGFGTITMRPTQYIIPVNYMSVTPLITLENVTHLWSSVPYHHTMIWLPPRLKCLAILIVSTDLRDNPLWLQKARQLPSLKLLVMTFHSPAFKRNQLIPTPRDLWERVFTDIHDERIVIRVKVGYTSIEAEVARRTGVSIWEVALLDAERHPDFSDHKISCLEYL